jgi:hypothetical protein
MQREAPALEDIIELRSGAAARIATKEQHT